MARAMVLDRPRTRLRLAEVAIPEPGPGQVLLKVLACGICRTDLHVVDGELTEPKLPIIPGHQIVAEVIKAGEGVTEPRVGARVGVPWLGWTDGDCKYCLSGRENLCDHARFTGYQIDGGYADYTVADSRFCLPIPEGYPDLQAVVPRAVRAATRLTLSDEDAAFLAAALPRLPGAADGNAPVTLDLEKPPAVRARADGQEQITELLLAGSTTCGPALRLCVWIWLFRTFAATPAWADPTFRGEFLCALYQHAVFVDRYIERLAAIDPQQRLDGKTLRTLWNEGTAA